MMWRVTWVRDEQTRWSQSFLLDCKRQNKLRRVSQTGTPIENGTAVLMTVTCRDIAGWSELY